MFMYQIIANFTEDYLSKKAVFHDGVRALLVLQGMKYVLSFWKAGWTCKSLLELACAQGSKAFQLPRGWDSPGQFLALLHLYFRVVIEIRKSVHSTSCSSLPHLLDSPYGIFLSAMLVSFYKHIEREPFIFSEYVLFVLSLRALIMGQVSLEALPSPLRPGFPPTSLSILS